VKDLKDYVPADAYFRGRLWWRCGIIRQTTGVASVDRAITVVNAPCIISSMNVSLRQEDWMRIQSLAPYRVVIPASYIKRAALALGEIAEDDRIYLTWGPDGDINVSDIIYVANLPFILRIAELQNPLSLFSHFQLGCTPITTLGLKITSEFNDFNIPFSVYRPIEPPDDILPQLNEVFAALREQGM